MNRIRTYAEIILAAIALTVFCGLGVGLAVDVFWTSDPKIAEAFRGGFIGALFAFVSVRIVDMINRLAELRRKNKSALSYLQIQYNATGGQIHDALYVLEIWDKFEAVLASGVAPMWTNKLHPFVIPQEKLLDLKNNALINELFSLHQATHKANHTMEDFGRAYDKMTEAWWSGKIKLPEYAEAMLAHDKNRRILQAFLEDLLARYKEAMVATRLLLRERNAWEKFLASKVETEYPESFKQARIAELKTLDAEIEEKLKNSAKRIAEVESRVSLNSPYKG